jgi:nucleoside diphosphate kinase
VSEGAFPWQMLPPPQSLVVLESLKAEAGEPAAIDTVALVKPGVRAQLAKVLKYVRRGGFDCVAIRMLAPTAAEAQMLCEHVGGAGAAALQGRPCVALLLRRVNAVAAWLSVCGSSPLSYLATVRSCSPGCFRPAPALAPTCHDVLPDAGEDSPASRPDDPREASRVNQFALRSMLGSSLEHNALHASDVFAAAVRERAAFFPDFTGPSPPGADAVCGATRRQIVTADGGEEKTLKQLVLVVMCGAAVEEQAAPSPHWRLCPCTGPSRLGRAGFQEYVGVLESLFAEDFTLANLRLAPLARRQAMQLAGLLESRAAEETLARGSCPSSLARQRILGSYKAPLCTLPSQVPCSSWRSSVTMARHAFRWRCVSAPRVEGVLVAA